MDNKKNIGLALSGGGQRAAAFHLGVLTKLNELGILSLVNKLSTVSGGSIVGAFYIINKNNFKEFYNNFKELLKTNIELKILQKPHVYSKLLLILLICGLSFAIPIFILNNFWVSLPLGTLLTLIVLLITFAIFFPLFPIGNSLIEVYDELFFNDKHLEELPTNPVLIINATNLQTGTLITFERDVINDSTYYFWYDRTNVEFDLHKFPISVAVACSSCFPPLINPIKIYSKRILNLDVINSIIKSQRKPKPLIDPIVVDGGLYDNQGIYKIVTNKNFKCDIVICSDASQPYNYKNFSKVNPFGLLLWLINVITRRIRNFQIKNTVYNSDSDIFEMSYISLEWDYESCLEGFAENVFNRNVRNHILEYFEIPKDLRHASNKEREIKRPKIVNLLKLKIPYNMIIQNGLNERELEIISRIGTRLKGLTNLEIDLLERHGSTLTELQLRLYCPTFFPKIKSLELETS